VSLPGGVQLLQYANTWLDNLYPKAFKIAEDLAVSASVPLDTQPVAFNGLGFDAQWNGGFVTNVRRAIIANPIPLSQIVSGMKSVYNSDPSQGILYYESHNEIGSSSNGRLISQVDSANPTSRLAQKKSALAAALLLTTPGIPMIFQGNEMMDTSLNDYKTPVNWSTDVASYSGMRQLYTDLAALRTNQTYRSAGLTDSSINLYQQDSANNVLVYDRYSASQPGIDDVVVVANLSSTVFNGSSLYTVCLPFAGTWNVLFNSDSTSYSSQFGGVGPSGSVTAVATTACKTYSETYGVAIPLGDYSTLVLSQH
jgi:1,4-alpha-glucan branching enzyme